MTEQSIIMKLTSFLSAVLLFDILAGLIASLKRRDDYAEVYIMRINLPKIVFHDSDSKNQDDAGNNPPTIKFLAT